MGSFRRFQILTVLVGLLPATGYASTITFSNATPISIPGFGNATPYPSTITVTGMGPIAALAVSLINFSHFVPEDIGVLLVGPTGIGQVVFDGGTSTGIVNANLTFADGGALWPSTGPVASGTFQPMSVLWRRCLFGTGTSHRRSEPDDSRGQVVFRFRRLQSERCVVAFRVGLRTRRLRNDCWRI